MIWFGLGFRVGNRHQIQKQHEAEVAMLNQDHDADTVNHSLKETSFAQEMEEANRLALEKVWKQSGL